MFNQGEVYKRSDLHEKYGGQEQGGISTPAQHKMIFLFTASRGEDYGYSDGWSPDKKKFLYTGEGQIGDMTFIRGNEAIRDHLNDVKDLHLFEYVKSGYVCYVGKMIFDNYIIKGSKDRDGKSRKAIVFELTPVE